MLIHADIAKENTGVGKVEPNWQGLCKIAKVLGPATYKLEDTNGKRMPRTWNSLNLKKYFQ